LKSWRRIVKVEKVEDGWLQISSRAPDGTVSSGSIPFGTCVWCTGTAMHPLVRDLKKQLPPMEQHNLRSLIVDRFLRVKGAGGSIYAIGDCATIEEVCARFAAPPPFPFTSHTHTHSLKVFACMDARVTHY
jgi:NADH dehydrogenase FAD-containing subunit